MTYKSISPKFSQEFFKLVASAKSILITGHMSPDDDAIGATLALKHLIDILHPQKKVDIAFSGYPADRFSCFEGYQLITFNQDISQNIRNYQLLICLDGGQYSRFSSDPDAIKSVNFPKVCIDHHGSEADNFTLIAQVTSAASTSELIYKLSNKKINPDLEFCEAILLGILGDTGTFNYIKPGQYHLFDIVKKILSITQINIQEFKSRYMTIDPESFEVIRELMKNSQFLHIDNWPDFQISYLTRDYISKCKFTDSQISEGSGIFVSQYIRLIKDHGWGFVISPNSDGSCRLSFRSLPGSVCVRDLVERMGIGGGHDRASGAKIFLSDQNPLSPDKALEIITDWMKKNDPVLL
jgi:phosphoesterase RecJ-like protein